MRKNVLYFLIGCFCCFAAACHHTRNISPVFPLPPAQQVTGTSFYNTVAAWPWKQRDSLAVREILSGNIPSFFKKFVAIHSEITDSAGIVHRAVFYVSPDYLCTGTDDDWARIPLTPMAAQKIADSFQCFLPTRKMAGLIHEQAQVRLEPVPMYAFRDSSITMWQHHLIIEGQRKGRTGLISGIKKDVVITGKLLPPAKPGRVAIFGWHRLNGTPIQPLYTGHVNWYVDYSHGIRLVSRNIIVNGRQMDYTAVLKHPVYKQLLCDEEDCSFLRYAY